MSLDSSCFSELSDESLAALHEFYDERSKKEQRFEELKARAEVSNAQTRWSMDVFTEDWNASQFWVSLATPSHGPDLI